MKNFVQKVALLGAGMFLLLHTLMPHQHDANMASPQHIEQQQSAEDLFDFLQLAFHLDLGEGHLEKFPTGQYLALDFPLELQGEISFVFRDAAVELSPKAYPTLVFSFRNQCYSKQNQFRGPPSIA